MILNTTLSDLIVKKTVELTQLNINVMNREAIIISSSDPKRINTFHEGAQQVIQTGQELLIDDNCQHLKGTRPGINIPIFFQGEIVGVIGISGRMEEVIPFSKGVKMMTEMLLQQFFLMKQLAAEERAKDYLLQEIIAGVLPPDFNEVLARGELLGIDLTKRRSIMLIQLEADENELHALEKYHNQIKQFSSFFQTPQQVIISKVRRNRWLILTELNASQSEQQIKASLKQIGQQIISAISQWTQAEIKIALGHSYDQVYELKHSFREAVRVLDIMKQYPKKGPIQHIDEVALELLLDKTNEQAKRMMIEQSLGTLVQYQELLQTLQTLYDCNLNINLTAQEMKIHRNTLLYRLERIKEILGFDPRIFRQAVQVQLALLLWHQDRTEARS
jgi:carbohydrate diacid regulator